MSKLRRLLRSKRLQKVTRMLMCVATVSISAQIGPAVAGQHGCLPFPSSNESELSQHIKRAFKIPDDAHLTLTAADTDEKTCYQKIRVTSPDKPSFHIDLFLSPDRRYLADKIIDVQGDTALEDHHNQDLIRTLAERYSLPSIGPAKAMTVAVFTDVQCPFCADLNRHLESLQQNVPEVRIIDIPLVSPVHNWSYLGRIAVLCGSEIGADKGWSVARFLLNEQRSLNKDNLIQKINSQEPPLLNSVDVKHFQVCVDNGKNNVEVMNGIENVASELAVDGTPSVFVNGRPLVGLLSETQLTEAISAAVGRK